MFIIFKHVHLFVHSILNVNMDKYTNLHDQKPNSLIVGNTSDVKLESLSHMSTN
jgi:hypothetical protein